MKTKLLSAVALCLALSAFTNAQDSIQPAPEINSSSASLAKLPPKPNAEKSASTNQTQATTVYVRPSADKRFKRYVNGVVGPFALARDVAVAGISTASNSPEEWGKSWEGFGRRFASNFARNAIKETTIYALDETLKLDSHFYRSQKKDFGSRFGNALLSTVTARRASGRRVVGVPRLLGTYGASVIAYEAWYPKRYGYKDGLRNGTISLGANAAFNLFKEFIWKK